MALRSVWGQKGFPPPPYTWRLDFHHLMRGSWDQEKGLRREGGCPLEDVLDVFSEKEVDTDLALPLLLSEHQHLSFCLYWHLLQREWNKSPPAWKLHLQVCDLQTSSQRVGETPPVRLAPQLTKFWLRRCCWYCHPKLSAKMRWNILWLVYKNNLT